MSQARPSAEVRAQGVRRSAFDTFDEMSWLSGVRGVLSRALGRVPAPKEEVLTSHPPRAPLRLDSDDSDAEPPPEDPKAKAHMKLTSDAMRELMELGGIEDAETHAPVSMDGFAEQVWRVEEPSEAQAPSSLLSAFQVGTDGPVDFDALLRFRADSAEAGHTRPLIEVMSEARTRPTDKRNGKMDEDDDEESAEDESEEDESEEDESEEAESEEADSGEAESGEAESEEAESEEAESEEAESEKDDIKDKKLMDGKQDAQSDRANPEPVFFHQQVPNEKAPTFWTPPSAHDGPSMDPASFQSPSQESHMLDQTRGRQDAPIVVLSDSDSSDEEPTNEATSGVCMDENYARELDAVLAMATRFPRSGQDTLAEDGSQWDDMEGQGDDDEEEEEEDEEDEEEEEEDEEEEEEDGGEGGTEDDTEKYEEGHKVAEFDQVENHDHMDESDQIESVERNDSDSRIHNDQEGQAEKLSEPTDTFVEEPGEPTDELDEPLEEADQEPVKSPEEPVKDSEEAFEEPIDRTVDVPIDRPFNETMDEPVNHPEESVDDPVAQRMEPTELQQPQDRLDGFIDKAPGESAEEPIRAEEEHKEPWIELKEPVEKPMDPQDFHNPMDESLAEPAEDGEEYKPTNEPVHLPADEPRDEPIDKPVEKEASLPQEEALTTETFLRDEATNESKTEPWNRDGGSGPEYHDPSGSILPMDNVDHEPASGPPAPSTDSLDTAFTYEPADATPSTLDPSLTKPGFTETKSKENAQPAPHSSHDTSESAPVEARIGAHTPERDAARPKANENSDESSLSTLDSDPSLPMPLQDSPHTTRSHCPLQRVTLTRAVGTPTFIVRSCTLNPSILEEEAAESDEVLFDSLEMQRLDADALPEDVYHSLCRIVGTSLLNDVYVMPDSMGDHWMKQDSRQESKDPPEASRSTKRARRSPSPPRRMRLRTAQERRPPRAYGFDL
ncbi:hypothetical protein MCAP1_000286 [Malassezia caprae]|uniref:Uncharacterized protein n=1 Tax=Malassezia caprae TaxID=1381934 RepID=A0AAF0E4M4_9BASI|nr:hypothetical protein MCAP1_000286 [Malassezia caprae]